MIFLCVMAATKGLYAQPFLRRLKDRGHRVLVPARAALSVARVRLPDV